MFDAVVCNPPYVADRDRSSLPVEVAGWEPAEALYSGPLGTEAIAEVVRESPRHLRPGGLLALEIGAGQDTAVQRLVEATPGLDFLTLFHDFSGIARGVLALAGGGEA